MEVFRFLDILDDARRHARERVLTRAFKLPNTTEPTRTWAMHGKFEWTPDRPEVSIAYILGFERPRSSLYAHYRTARR